MSTPVQTIASLDLRMAALKDLITGHKMLVRSYILPLRQPSNRRLDLFLSAATIFSSSSAPRATLPTSSFAETARIMSHKQPALALLARFNAQCSELATFQASNLYPCPTFNTYDFAVPYVVLTEDVLLQKFRDFLREMLDLLGEVNVDRAAEIRKNVVC